jgi:hypothetical protein
MHSIERMLTDARTEMKRNESDSLALALQNKTNRHIGVRGDIMRYAFINVCSLPRRKRQEFDRKVAIHHL